MTSPKKTTSRGDSAFLTRLLIAAGVLICALTWGCNFALVPLLLFIFGIGGIGMCVSIILKTIGAENAITRQLCAAESTSDCSEVLAHGVLWKGITWGDIGLMYFITQVLFLWFSAATNNIQAFFPLLDVPAILDIPLTFGLLAYQGFVLKQWCRLCLSVTAILWIQAGLLTWFALRQGHLPVTGVFPILTFLTCLVISAAWILIKPLVVKAEENKKVREQFTRLKRIPEVFVSLLKQQRQVEFEQEIVLGDRNAPVHLFCVVNPYCKACAADFPKLNSLLVKFPETVRITLCFYVPAQLKNNKRTVAAQALVDAYFSHSDPAKQRLLFKDWFRMRKLALWLTIWGPTVPARDTELLIRHERWCKEGEIKFTPTHFLNGYEWPQPYKIGDLTHVMESVRASLVI